MTKIWLGENVSDQNLAVNRRQFWSYWRLLTAKFWSLTFPCSQILVTDISSHPNSGHWLLLPTQFWSHWRLHRDMYYEDFSLFSWFEAEKDFSCFLKTLFHVQGVNIYDISIFFWPRLGPFKLSLSLNQVELGLGLAKLGKTETNLFPSWTDRTSCHLFHLFSDILESPLSWWTCAPSRAPPAGCAAPWLTCCPPPPCWPGIAVVQG